MFSGPAPETMRIQSFAESTSNSNLTAEEAAILSQFRNTLESITIPLDERKRAALQIIADVEPDVPRATAESTLFSCETKLQNAHDVVTDYQKQITDIESTMETIRNNRKAWLDKWIVDMTNLINEVGTEEEKQNLIEYNGSIEAFVTKAAGFYEDVSLISPDDTIAILVNQRTDFSILEKISYNNTFYYVSDTFNSFLRIEQQKLETATSLLNTANLLERKYQTQYNEAMSVLNSFLFADKLRSIFDAYIVEEQLLGSTLTTVEDQMNTVKQTILETQNQLDAAQQTLTNKATALTNAQNLFSAAGGTEEIMPTIPVQIDQLKGTPQYQAWLNATESFTSFFHNETTLANLGFTGANAYLDFITLMNTTVLNQTALPFAIEAFDTRISQKK